MTIEQAVLEKIKILPMNRKQEVLDFAEFLEEKDAKPRPRRSSYGLLADLEINLTEEDIAEASELEQEFAGVGSHALVVYSTGARLFIIRRYAHCPP